MSNLSHETVSDLKAGTFVILTVGGLALGLFGTAQAIQRHPVGPVVNQVMQPYQSPKAAILGACSGRDFDLWATYDNSVIHRDGQIVNELNGPIKTGDSYEIRCTGYNLAVLNGNVPIPEVMRFILPPTSEG